MGSNRCAAAITYVLCSCFCLVTVAAPPSRPATQRLPRIEWSGINVDVHHEGARWTIDGRRNHVVFGATDFSMLVRAGAIEWSMRPLTPSDLAVKVVDQNL